jgi:clan AA aspartic protease (TIGR02281 family)
VSPALYNTLVQNGTVTRADMRGTQTYRTANGEPMKGLVFILRSVQVGDKVAYDVEASVSEGVSNNAMLLGQSFLGKFKSWSIDNQYKRLVLDK